jgi:hypothetical protein
MKKSLGINFLLCVAAVFAALFAPALATGQTDHPVAIAVRPTGEADVAAMGLDGGVYFYYATPGSPWASYTVWNFDLSIGPRPYGPAMVVGADSEPYLVFRGPETDGDQLVFCWQSQGSGSAGLDWWGWWEIADNTAISAAIAKRANGEVDIVYQSTKNSLVYDYMEPPGYLFNLPGHIVTIAGPGSALSAPAIAVREDGEADIVAEGPDNSLFYYYATPGSVWVIYRIAGPGTTFSAPAIVVRSDGEADVVAQGPNNSLLYYHATPGSPWHVDKIAGPGTTFSAPAIVVRSDNEADVVARGPNNSLLYYHATPGSQWYADTVAGIHTTFSAPAIAVRSDGEADLVAVGPVNSLRYYHATPGTPIRLQEATRPTRQGIHFPLGPPLDERISCGGRLTGFHESLCQEKSTRFLGSGCITGYTYRTPFISPKPG